MPKTRKKKFIDVTIHFMDLKRQKQQEIRNIIGNKILPSPLIYVSFEVEDEIEFTMDEGLLEDEDE